ncbi:MAG: tetratricopeptide repeat protein [Candidatus Saccharicenans sp.]
MRLPAGLKLLLLLCFSVFCLGKLAAAGEYRGEACYDRASLFLPDSSSKIGCQEEQSKGVRAVSLRLLSDEDFDSVAGGKKKVETVLRKISEEFEAQFRLKFIWEGWGTWISPSEARTVEDLAERLDSPHFRQKADLVVALTAQKNISPEHSGLALIQSGIVVVVYTSEEKKLEKVLKHELGHIFGAVHVPFPDSVMACGEVGENFDSINHQIISLCRERPFSPTDFPFPPEIREKLEELYLKIRANLKKAGIWKGDGGADSRSCFSDCWVMLAQLSLEKGDYRKTLTYLEEASQLNPGSLEVLNLRAICLRKMGEVARAVELYQKILKDFPDRPQVLYNLGIALGKMNRLKEAEEIYLKVIELKPYFVEAHNNLGEIYLKMDRLDEAERAFLKVIELNDRYALAYSNLAETYLRKKNFNLARVYADKSLELNPNLSSAHNVKGNLLSQEGKLQEALSEYKKALAANPEYDKAYYNLGLVASDLGRMTEAEQYFKQALSLNPYFAQAYAGLGLLYLRQNRWEEAIQLLRKAEENGYHQARLYVNLSYAYMGKEDWKKAEEAARKAIEKDPTQPQAYNNLGISLARQDKLNEAREALSTALNLSPLDRDIVLNLATVELNTGHLERSLELLLKALALKPEDERNAQVYHQIGLIYFKKGEYEKSWEFCLKALQSGARVEPEVIDELRRRLKK